MVLTDNAVNCFCEEVGMIIGGDHDRNRSIAAHIRLPLPCADGSTSLETTISRRSKSQSRQSGKSRRSPLPAFGSQNTTASSAESNFRTSAPVEDQVEACIQESEKIPGDRARFGQSFCCIALKGGVQIETAGTGGIRARIRRVASYATAVRSVGRSGRKPTVN